MSKVNLSWHIQIMVFWLVALVLACCSTPRSTETFERITVVVQSRGINDKYVIDKDLVTCYKMGQVAYRHRKQDILSDLLLSIQTRPEELDQVIVNTENSFADRSPLARVSIISSQGTYHSPQFDFFDPPKALKEFMEQLELIDQNYQ